MPIGKTNYPSKYIGFNNKIRSGQARTIAQNLAQNCLLGFWKLDETSGVRADSSPNGYDLTEFNTVGADLGIINDGAYIVGLNNERLEVSDPALSPAEFTLSLWWKADGVVGPNGHSLAYHKADFSPFNNEWTLTIDPPPIGVTGQVSFQMWDNTVFTSKDLEFASSFAPYDPDDWFHIVATYDGANLQLHVNNEASPTLALGAPRLINNTQAFVIGAVNAANNYAHTIDEVGLWCRVLSPAEISYLYCNRLGVSFDFTNPFKGLGGMDDGFDGGFWGTP